MVAGTGNFFGMFFATRGVASTIAQMAAVRKASGATSAAMAQTARMSGVMATRMATLGVSTLAVVGAVAGEFAKFERQTTLAAFAAGDYATNVARVTKQSKELSKEFALAPVQAARLVREVEQLGVGNANLSKQIGRAGAALELVTDAEIDAAEATQTLFRLLQSTGEIGTTDAMALASALKLAGDRSAAGTQATFLFAQELQTLGKLAGFTSGEIIGLAAAFADLDDKGRELARTSLIRLFTKEFLDPEQFAKVAKFMGLTVDAANQLRRDDPFVFFTSFVEALNTATDETKRAEVLNALGFANARDIKTLITASATLDKLQNSIMPGVRDELKKSEKDLRIVDMMGELGEQLAFKWDAFTASVRRAAVTIGSVLAPVLMPLLDALTFLFELIAKNKFLATILTTGAFALGARFAGGMLGRVGGLLGAGGGRGRGGGIGLSLDSLMFASMLGSNKSRFFGMSGDVQADVMRRTKGGVGGGQSFSEALAWAMIFGGSRGRIRGTKGTGGGRLGSFATGDQGMMALMSGLLPGRGLFAKGASGTSRFGRRFAGGSRAVAGAGGGRFAAGGGGILTGLFKGRGTALGLGLARSGGGRLALAAAGPVGIVISALSILAPLFERLGKSAEKMGGPFKLLATIFKTIAVVGNAIKFVFNTIVEAIKRFVGLIKKIPIVGDLFKGLGKGFDKINSGLDKTNDFLSREGGAFGPGKKVEQNITVNAMGSDAALGKAGQNIGNASANYFRTQGFTVA